MSINIPSDDNSGDLPEVNVTPRLSQEGSEHFANNDDMFDLICQPTSRQDSGVSTLTMASSAASLAGSSGYDSSSKRKNIKSGKKHENKVTKKQKLAEERAAKQALAELNKVFKPGECMKYMKIEVHPSLLSQWFMVELKREADCQLVEVSPTPDLMHPGLVMWSRKVPRTLSGEVLHLTKPTEACDRVLLIYEAYEIVPYVMEHTLSNHLTEIKELVGTNLTLVVFGLKEFMKKNGRKKDSSCMTSIDFEMAITDLLVSCGCDAATAETANELALLILQFTKAIAEAPSKIAKRDTEEQSEHYLLGDKKKSVAVDKQGNGLAGLWQQMVAVLPHSSLETSRAVCAQYKSPLALYEALQQPNAVNTLADLGVSRAGVAGRPRRLGPELARRLATLLTADDGDCLFD